MAGRLAPGLIKLAGDDEKRAKELDDPLAKALGPTSGGLPEPRALTVVAYPAVAGISFWK